MHPMKVTNTALAPTSSYAANSEDRDCPPEIAERTRATIVTLTIILKLSQAGGRPDWAMQQMDDLGFVPDVVVSPAPAADYRRMKITVKAAAPGKGDSRRTGIFDDTARSLSANRNRRRSGHSSCDAAVTWRRGKISRRTLSAA